MYLERDIMCESVVKSSEELLTRVQGICTYKYVTKRSDEIDFEIIIWVLSIFTYDIFIQSMCHDFKALLPCYMTHTLVD